MPRSRVATRLARTVLTLLLAGLAVGWWLYYRAEGARELTYRLLRDEERRSVALEQSLEAGRRALVEVTLERDEREKTLREKESALKRVESLLLAVRSSEALSTDPVRALLFALESAERSGGLESDGALLSALREVRQLRSLPCRPDASDASTLSPDGRRVLVVSGTDEARIRDVATGELVCVSIGPELEGEDAQISAAFSPDGSSVVTASRLNDNARLWSVETGRTSLTLEHTGPVTAVVFDSTGQRVLTASRDRSARIWDTRTGAVLHVLQHALGVDDLWLGPDGRRVLTTCGLGQIRSTVGVWEVASGEESIRFDLEAGVSLAALNSDGRVVFVQRSSPVSIREPSVGGVVATFEGTDPWPPAEARTSGATFQLSVQLSADGTRGAVTRRVGDAQDATIVDASTGKRLRALDGFGARESLLAISPNGARLATTFTPSESSAGTTEIRVWNVETGAVEQTLDGSTGVIRTAMFSADGKRLLTASDSGVATVWDLSGRELVESYRLEGTIAAWSPDRSRALLEDPPGLSLVDARSGEEIGEIPVEVPVDRVVFSPRGDRLLGVTDARILIWDTGTGLRLTTLEEDEGSQATCRVFSPDGKRILSASSFRGPPPVAHVWETETGRRLQSIRGHARPITFGSFSADGKRVLTVSDRRARVWDVATGRRLANMPETPASPASPAATVSVAAAELSPDGRRVAVLIGKERILKLYSADDGSLLVDGSTPYPNDVQFTPDSQWLLGVRAGAPTVLRLEELATLGSKNPKVIDLSGHERPIAHTAITSDGRRLATAAAGTVRLWDLGRGKQLLAMPLGADVTGIGFSRDGASACVSTADGSAHVWPLDLLSVARARKPRELSQGEWDRLGLGTESERRSDAVVRELRQRTGDIVPYAALAAGEGAEEAKEAGKELRKHLRWPFSRVGQLARGVRKSVIDAWTEKIEEVIERHPPGDAKTIGLLGRSLALGGERQRALRYVEEAAVDPRRAPELASTLAELRERAGLPVSYASIDASLDGPEIVVAGGATWRFFRGTREPSAGLHWTGLHFEDADWDSGSSGFGYGDADDTTLLDTMLDTYTTVYLRRTFDLPGRLDDYERIWVSLFVDDGCVVYLNRSEVGRVRAGQEGQRLAFNAMATSSVSEPLTEVTLELKKEVLRSDGNVLAIQGLNRSLSSSDFSLLPRVLAQPSDRDARRRRLLEQLRSRPKTTDGEALTRYLQGRILQLQDRHHGAVSVFEKLVESDPEALDPVLRLAESLLAGSLLAEDERGEALSKLHRASRFSALLDVRAAEANASAWQTVLRPSGMFESLRALVLSMRAVAGSPESSKFVDTLGVAHYRCGLDRGAIKILKRHTEPTALDLYFLAMAYHRLEDFTRADESLAQGQRWEGSQGSISNVQRKKLATIRAEVQSMLAEKETAKKE